MTPSDAVAIAVMKPRVRLRPWSPASGALMPNGLMPGSPFPVRA
jgi:hypothetical protein